MGDKPFDARETLMCETTAAPDAHWRTVSLVTAVRGLVAWTPADNLAWPREPDRADPYARLDAFQAATDELTRRGLDADSLVRFGMRNEIASSLMTALLVKLLGLSIPELARQRGIDLDAWSELLPPMPVRDVSNWELSAENLMRFTEMAARSQHPLIVPWIMRTPLEGLVTLSPPDHDDLYQQNPMISEDLKLYELYAWLVDRFSTTSLRDWLTSSLHCEYRWQAELEPPPCPTRLMLDREVDKDELNAEIARRSALGVANGEPDPEAILGSDMASHARALLGQGRYREAAALFEFAARRRPTDAEARNNLGFCLIPEDPRRALSDLEAAAHMGYQHIVVNGYNRVCCQLALRQTRAAVAAADAYWATQDDDPGAATLWRWSPDGSWEIINVADPRLALADLIVLVAQAEGWREDEQRWRSRLQSRQNGT
jgi:hypothetical protein